jgi:hypothetical protein
MKHCQKAQKSRDLNTDSIIRRNKTTAPQGGFVKMAYFALFNRHFFVDCFCGFRLYFVMVSAGSGAGETAASHWQLVIGQSLDVAGKPEKACNPSRALGALV